MQALSDQVPVFFRNGLLSFRAKNETQRKPATEMYKRGTFVKRRILCLFNFNTKVNSEHLTVTLAKYGPAANYFISLSR